MSIHLFCFSISFSRKDASGWVKSDEQHIIGIDLPCVSTSARKRFQFDSSAISRNPAYHSRPSMSSLTAKLIHSETFMVPSLRSACIKAFGNAASLGIIEVLMFTILLSTRLSVDCVQQTGIVQGQRLAR